MAARVSAGAVPRPSGSSRIAAQLVCDHEAVVLVAHHQRVAAGRQAFAARRGFLQQRALAVERVQLLGIVLSRKRPQAGAGAAAQDHRLDHGWSHAQLDHCSSLF
jgi:hypothetical protein